MVTVTLGEYRNLIEENTRNSCRFRDISRLENENKELKEKIKALEEENRRLRNESKEV